MTAVYLGSISVGESIPGASTAITAGITGITSALDNLLAQLAALQAFVPVPLDFAAQLTLAQSMVTAIIAAQAAIPPLPIPDIAAQIAIILAQVAALIAQIAAIQANLTVMTDLTAPLAAAGVHAYAFDGDAGDLGPELDSAIASTPGISPSDHANAIALVTTIGATWDAMSLVFKVTP